MMLSEAKELIGKMCSIRYTDRGGRELETVSKIYDATYVPLYGGYLVVATDDIRFDRIVSICEVAQTSNTDTVTTTTQERELLPLAA